MTSVVTVVLMGQFGLGHSAPRQFQTTRFDVVVDFPSPVAGVPLFGTSIVLGQENPYSRCVTWHRLVLLGCLQTGQAVAVPQFVFVNPIR